MKKKKIALILLNMGGPDRPESVKPFLFNLFNDPAIIPLPAIIRWFLARFISSRRASVARDIYDKIGGGSPLLKLTRDQATVLEKEFQDESNEIRVFIAMRYWHPMSRETVDEVKAFAADEIVLLPLYPQYSKATSGSSFTAWNQAAAAAGLKAATYTVCCYPTQPGLIREHAAHISNSLAEAAKHDRTRILFSAHGLPEKNIENGDPYAWQIENTAKAIIAEINIKAPDWIVCYQSRVGPQVWIKPYIKDELARAANDKVAVVVVPIAFVSEHSETLVELDIQYRELADKLGVAGYFRTPAVGTGSDFIKGLADVVRQTLERKMEYCSPYYSSAEKQHCPDFCRHCPNPDHLTSG